ncbi:MAG: protein-(glutamine-N5) methyltransferase, release factor-specific [Gammaproteobacteria bacterium]|nr:protein-(glutamine-N5) methyltransferase, release factor-specific [Gammaproteobacteria bacterium]HAD70735.1 peptide chain release factor N(5)-glutamine methyltransferase [Gammaproteobacteria bacterium]|tara:strand:+ start:3507 stop:4352 length:846 start_codon:yes stop_codon:yes gene_type:complete
MSISIKQALARGESLKKVSVSWKLDAELFLSHELGKTREYLYSWSNELISERHLESYKGFLERRAAGEPVAYIIGHTGFWDFKLRVDKRVLIPRPETELIVEKALELGQRLDSKDAKVADLGTGSGAIAIALARSNPGWHITAVDISEGALQLAQLNAQEQQANNIEFSLASWCDGLAANQYDMIAANPPYVQLGDNHLEKGVLLFEPKIALITDSAGLGSLRRIICQSKRVLKKDAWLLLEHGFNQQASLKALLLKEGFDSVLGYKDYAGNDRMVCAHWS